MVGIISNFEERPKTGPYPRQVGSHLSLQPSFSSNFEFRDDQTDGLPEDYTIPQQEIYQNYMPYYTTLKLTF